MTRKPATLAAAAAAALVISFTLPPSRVQAAPQLTPAQRKVIAGLADGLLNKQIAYEMDISVATVKAHMTAIFRKLGANNRTQALLIYKEATSL